MLQIVTINVGGSFREQYRPPHTVAEEIRQQVPLDFSQPFVMGLQEIFRIENQAHSFISLDDELCKLAPNLNYCFATEADSAAHPHAKAWENDGFKHASHVSDGNGVLSNLAYASWPWSMPAAGYPGAMELCPILVPLGSPRLHSTGNRNTKPRNAIVASLKTSAGEIFLINTHLTTLVGEREENADRAIVRKAMDLRLLEINGILSIVGELREAERLAQQEARPIILLGDFNTSPSSQEFAVLLENFVLLSPAAAPERLTHKKERVHIDHILMNDPQQRFRLRHSFIHTQIENEKFTDHYPVVALLEDELGESN
jgi:endonuclease/exonuclease/phosphatase family metal-dependent hydrolase